MTTAFVLINVDRPKIKQSIKEIREITGVSEVYTVAGEYDLVAVLRVKDNTELSRILADEMPHMKGITHTKTLIALEAFSDVNLDKVFKV